MVLDMDVAVARPSTVIEATPRLVTDDQLRRFERNLAEMFAAFGMDMESASTADTPRRFVRAMFDATAGYDGDPKVMTAFETECGGGPDCRLSQIVEGPIQFYALCEHHALPFFGNAWVGYTANARIIGISKLIRLVRLSARRFTVQERVGHEVADALQEMLQPHGVAIYLEANHLCTQMRGVREAAPLTRTTSWRGEYEANPALRAEFFTACGLQR